MIKEIKLVLDSEDVFLLLKAVRKEVDEYYNQKMHREEEKLYHIKQQIEFETQDGQHKNKID